MTTEVKQQYLHCESCVYGRFVEKGSKEMPTRCTHCAVEWDGCSYCGETGGFCEACYQTHRRE